jgi:nucleoid DNA-binding protein
MNYDGVIKKVSKQTKVDEAQVKETIEKFFEILSTVVFEEEIISVPWFGTFHSKKQFQFSPCTHLVHKFK